MFSQKKGRVTERGRGQIFPGSQGSGGLIMPNASRSEGLHKGSR